MGFQVMNVTKTDLKINSSLLSAGCQE